MLDYFFGRLCAGEEKEYAYTRSIKQKIRAENAKSVQRRKKHSCRRKKRKSHEKKGYKPDDRFASTFLSGAGTGEEQEPGQSNTVSVHELVSDFKAGKKASGKFQFDLEADKRASGKKKS